MTRVPLLAAAGAIALAAAVVAFWASDGSDHPSVASVDAGFARDMAVHHAQAARMAGYTREHASTTEVQRLAAAIEDQQQLEIGQMLGWLEAWGLQRTAGVPPMAWMGAGHDHRGGAMPGMATPAEMDELVNLAGNELEIRFLQLMIRHHQGGLPMALHAAKQAENDFVRAVATEMHQTQAEEIDRMTHWLTERGGEPLPKP